MPVVEDEHVLGIIGRRRLQRLGRRRFGSDPRVRGHGRPAAGAGPRARRSAVGGARHDEQRRASTGSPSRSRAGWPGCSRRDSVSEAVQHAGGRRCGASRGGRVSGELLPVEEAQATRARGRRAGRGLGVDGARGGARPRPGRPGDAPRPRCRRGTTRRWTATRSGPPTWHPATEDAPGPADGRRGVAGRVARPTRGSWPGRRSGSRPGRRCRRAPTPSCRWSDTTPLDEQGGRRAARPRGAGTAARRDARPCPREAGQRDPAARQRRRGRATSSPRPGDAGDARRRRARGRGGRRRRVAVRRRPIVAVLATGDEVRAPGTDLGPAGIPDANGPGLRALVREPARVPLELGIAVRHARGRRGAAPARARRGGPRRRVAAASRSGPYDVVRLAFDNVGHMNLWRVAVQPGKPFAFGRADVGGPRRPGPAVRPAGQPGVGVRHVRAVRAARAPAARGPGARSTGPSTGRSSSSR